MVHLLPSGELPEGASDEESFVDWAVPTERVPAVVPANHTGSFTDKVEWHAESEPSEAPESPVDSGRRPQQDEDDLFMSHLVAFVEAMRPSKPEMLRACPAFVVLACLGQVFWSGRNRNFFHLSKVTKAYDEFLSHSWQVATWKKVLLLLMLKNGLPACLVAGLGTLLMAGIWQLGFLPGYVKSEFVAEAPDARHSFWCASVGLVLAPLTLLCWKSRSQIFVDRVCINQFDVVQKSEGILNIGAMLKASRSFLLVWDETYIDRLWCIFELAAFLRSHPDMADGNLLSRCKNLSALNVFPVALGYMSLSAAMVSISLAFVATTIPTENLWLQWSLTLVLGACLGLGMAHAARAHFRALEAMRSQLRRFELQKTICYCCSVNHVDPHTSEPIPICDRETVGRCVTSWFGSEQAFNESVRSSVARALQQQLGCDAFPYVWLVCSTSPLMWSCIDVLTSFVRDDFLREDALRRLLIRYPTYWLLSFPTLFTVGLLWSRVFRAQGWCWLTEAARNILVIMLMVPFAVCIVALELWTHMAFEKLLGSVVFAAGSLLGFLSVRAIHHASSRRWRYMDVHGAY